MEETEYINQLAEKWIDGTITQEEKAVFNKWYNSFDFSELELAVPEGFTENQLRERLRLSIKNQIPQFHKTTTIQHRLWSRIAIAAAVAMTLFGAGLFYYNSNNRISTAEAMYAGDVQPGAIGATLTLANGKKIKLTSAAKGKLADESGVTISKTAEGKLVYEIKDDQAAGADQINTLNTANGETYQVNLPDGTSVWLNAESSLSYPASFTGLKQRTVQLKGEAYLEVAKDKLHPFVVKTDRQDIQVLGTHFNVYAYAGEPVKTSLAEGSVKVSITSLRGGTTMQSPADIILKPGEQSILTAHTIKVADVDLGEVLAWKNGNFDFNNERIADIMNTLSRWYNIQVVYQGDIRDKTFSGNISRFKNISQVLRMLEKTKDVHFKVEGRRITVME